MPYAKDGHDVPKTVPEDKREQFAAVWNKIFADSKDEKKAFAAAYAAIKKSGRRHSQKDIDMIHEIIANAISLLDIDVEELMPENAKEEMQDENAEKRDMDANVGGGVDRDKLKASDFVFPDSRAFPVVSAGDVKDAVSSWGRYKGKHSFEEFKRRLTSLARRKGFESSLPTEWKEETKKEMSLRDKDCLIEGAFYKQFIEPYENHSLNEYEAADPSPLWVRGVYDQYLIACYHSKDSVMPAHYRVQYSMSNDDVTFDRPSDWKRVEQVWQEIPEQQLVIGIGKSADEKQLVYGVVLKPEPYVDLQGDVITKEDIEACAHRFMEESRNYDFMHQIELTSKSVVPVESYIAPQDLTWNGKTIPQGSWVVVSHVIDENIWKKIKGGDINAYSIRGLGYRKEV